MDSLDILVSPSSRLGSSSFVFDQPPLPELSASDSARNASVPTLTRLGSQENSLHFTEQPIDIQCGDENTDCPQLLLCSPTNQQLQQQVQQQLLKLQQQLQQQQEQLQQQFSFQQQQQQYKLESIDTQPQSHFSQSRQDDIHPLDFIPIPLPSSSYVPILPITTESFAVQHNVCLKRKREEEEQQQEEQQQHSPLDTESSSESDSDWSESPRRKMHKREPEFVQPRLVLPQSEATFQPTEEKTCSSAEVDPRLIRQLTHIMPAGAQFSYVYEVVWSKDIVPNKHNRIRVTMCLQGAQRPVAFWQNTTKESTNGRHMRNQWCYVPSDSNSAMILGKLNKGAVAQLRPALHKKQKSPAMPKVSPQVLLPQLLAQISADEDGVLLMHTKGSPIRINTAVNPPYLDMASGTKLIVMTKKPLVGVSVERKDLSINASVRQLSGF